VKVDLDGIDQRTLALPIPARNYVALATGKEGVLYIGEGSPVANSSKDDGPGIRALWRFTLEKRKTDEVLRGLDTYAVSFNGEKLLYKKDERGRLPAQTTLSPVVIPRASHSTWAACRPRSTLAQSGGRCTTRPGASSTRFPLTTPTITASISRKPKKRYQPYLDGIVHVTSSIICWKRCWRGHYRPHVIRGPHEPDHSPKPGLLGADYSIDRDRYKFAHIFNGENWNLPCMLLSRSQVVNVHEGEYLLAVNGASSMLQTTSTAFSKAQRANRWCCMLVRMPMARMRVMSP